MARQLLYLGRAAGALELVRLAQDGSRSSAAPRTGGTPTAVSAPGWAQSYVAAQAVRIWRATSSP
ncbi:hypothetical protein ACWDUI_18760 [Streptosporangium sandarakinum]|uniref:hypothetical protein n=1 Tax=Streptosporangium sandarakinum TaxID=1260955 RepID=UPI0037B5AA89